MTEINSSISQIGQLGLDIDGEASGDYSGYSVSLNSDGTIVAIGARHNDGNSGESGHVRVYQYNGSQWVQIGQDIDGEASGDYSGFSVSLNSDGTIVAIGAIGNDGNSGESGHVRVYQYNGSQWVQIGQDIDGEAYGDQSGYSVSLNSLNSDGTIVAIGAAFNDGNGSNSGHVRVYQYNGSQWVQIGLDIDGEAGIGAAFNDGNGSNSGHVRVYQYNGSQWVQLGLDIDGEAGNDNSGWSVSLNSDGTIVAIGARFNAGNGNNSGHVRVYQYNGSQWVQIGLDIDSEANGQQSGWSVSLNSDGTIVAIGAIYNNENDGNGTNSGHVRVYQYNGSQWVQIGLDIDGEAK
jgi:hypothetical protein